MDGIRVKVRVSGKNAVFDANASVPTHRVVGVGPEDGAEIFQAPHLAHEQRVRVLVIGFVFLGVLRRPAVTFAFLAIHVLRTPRG